jgi:enoyl-CoA hydratase
MSEVVTVDRDGPVTVVRIARPEVHNALNAEVLQQLDAAVADASVDGATRAIVLTGTGDRAFSAGADLDELAGLDAAGAHAVLRSGQQVLRRIETSPVPVIAAVNGLALGGGFELVLASSFPVLAERSTLGLPEAGLGLIPGYGGTQRLTRTVGPQVARHVMLTGQRLTAARAYELGLTPLPPVTDAEVVDVACRAAAQVADRGPQAVRAILDAVRVAGDAPVETGLALESALAGIATGSAEAAEGVAAFKERRRPEFAATTDPEADRQADR